MNVHSHSPQAAVNRELRGKDAVGAHPIELPLNLSQSHGAITRHKMTRLKVGDKVSVRVGVFGQEYARTRVDDRTPWTTETVRDDGEVTGRDGEKWVVTCSDIPVKLKRNEIAFISRPQQWTSTPQAVRSSTRILQWVKTDASRWLPRAVRVRMATTKPMTKTRKTTIPRSARRTLGLTAGRGAPEMPPVRFPWTGRAGVAVEVEKVSVCKCVLRSVCFPRAPVRAPCLACACFDMLLNFRCLYVWLPSRGVRCVYTCAGDSGLTS
jgi:hypothetical protein